HYLAFGRREGIPGFAGGGLYPGGLALVGERGPELINFKNPGQVYTASQTQELLSKLTRPSENNQALVNEVRQLRADNQAQAQAMVQMQSRLNRLLERWDSTGMPE